MEYKLRTYPLFAACGLNCGLCPRYHTVGPSRCPGCAGEGFSEAHPPCGILSCCERRGLEYCFLCEEYPCKKYEGVDETDSFISHKNQFHDMDKAKQMGMEAYGAELNRKVQILEELLQSYDDGRQKGFFCLATNLLDLADIEAIREKLSNTPEAEVPLKEKAKRARHLFQEAADEKGIELKLRK